MHPMDRTRRREEYLRHAEEELRREAQRKASDQAFDPTKLRVRRPLGCTLAFLALAAIAAWQAIRILRELL